MTAPSRAGRCRGSSCGWSTTTARRCPGTASRPARSRCAGRGSPPATSATRTPRSSTTGWLRTGDIASVDEKAFVQITDRSKDVIKSGGEWISSVELENELMAHPDVIEAAVIAKPDERWAERPAVLRGAQRAREPPAPRTCVEHLRRGWPSGGCPTSSPSSTEIPKTSVGKFDKKVLRGQLADGEPRGVASRSS